MAEGANIREGYWRAEQESEGIFRDSEIDQALRKTRRTTARGFRNSSDNSTFTIHHSQFRFTYQS